MNVSELLQQGVNLMLMGMGSVFIFLGLLILMMTLVARFAARWPEEEAAPSLATPAATQEAGDEEMIAVISAAIAQHRARPMG
jgi:oxaloacetate decarboxylase gamma subunit